MIELILEFIGQALSSICWPATILIVTAVVLCLFRSQVADFIARLEQVKSPFGEFRSGAAARQLFIEIQQGQPTEDKQPTTPTPPKMDSQSAYTLGISVGILTMQTLEHELSDTDFLIIDDALNILQKVEPIGAKLARALTDLRENIVAFPSALPYDRYDAHWTALREAAVDMARQLRAQDQKPVVTKTQPIIEPGER